MPVFFAAATRAIGRVFILHFEGGGDLLDFDIDAASARVKREFAKASAAKGGDTKGGDTKGGGTKGGGKKGEGFKVTRGMLENKYEWKATGGDDPKARKRDATLFNRKEGYEVVPMIQKVVDHFGYDSEADVHRIEEVIANDLPGNVRGQKKVEAWLIDHLSK